MRHVPLFHFNRPARQLSGTNNPEFKQPGCPDETGKHDSRAHCCIPLLPISIRRKDRVSCGGVPTAVITGSTVE